MWLRHLQTLVVQVLGSAYVIYKYMSCSGILLLLATISMFFAGLVKYGERTWALKCGSTSSICDRFNKSNHKVKPYRFVTEGKSEEEGLLEAHYSFAVCKSVFLDITLEPGLHALGYSTVKVIMGEDIYKLLEIELSLMYDIMYTKEAVIHTWYGFCIHLISLLGTATAFLLFQLSIRGRGDYSGANMIISYVLLVGALALEVITVCRALLSSWTCSFVHCKAERLHRQWDSCLAKTASSFLLFASPPCLASKQETGGTPLGSITCSICAPTTVLSQGADWLRRWASRIDGTSCIPQALTLCQHEISGSWCYKRYLSDIDGTHTNLSSRGRMILERMGAHKDFAQWSVNIDFDESILVWHIAIDVFIQVSVAGHELKLIEATKMLSNYMVFLLVAKPTCCQATIYISRCASTRKVRGLKRTIK